MKKVLIAAHDIGGANNIAYWLEDYIHRFEFDFLVRGPAKQLFFERYPDIHVMDECPTLSQYDLVITGSGWQTTLEIETIQSARELEIYCVTYIDHWVNYRERFKFNDEYIYPNEIWASDKYALAKAGSVFKDLVPKIRYVRSRYLSDLRRQFNRLKRSGKYSLICLEPIRSGVNYEEVYQALLDKFDSDDSILIRLHPSNAYSGLDILIELMDRQELNYRFSDNDLAFDLSSAKKVYGYQSTVLVHASLFDIPSYSYLLGGKLESKLPEVGIEYL